MPRIFHELSALSNLVSLLLIVVRFAWSGSMLQREKSHIFLVDFSVCKQTSYYRAVELRNALLFVSLFAICLLKQAVLCKPLVYFIMLMKFSGSIWDIYATLVHAASEVMRFFFIVCPQCYGISFKYVMYDNILFKIDIKFLYPLTHKQCRCISHLNLSQMFILLYFLL